MKNSTDSNQHEQMLNILAVNMAVNEASKK